MASNDRGSLPGGGTWKRYDNSNSPNQIYGDRVQHGNNQFTHPGGQASGAYYNYLEHPDHAREKETAGRLNELGFWDYMPGANIGPEAQYESERAVASYNQRLGYAANEAMRQGAMNLQSYRPGGSAAMLSGFYTGQANTLMGMRTEAPDSMFRWRQVQADRAADKARRTALLTTGISAAAALGAAALPLLAPAGAAAAGGIGAAVGGAMQGLGTAVGGYYMGQGLGQAAGNVGSDVGYQAQGQGGLGEQAAEAAGASALGQPVASGPQQSSLEMAQGGGASQGGMGAPSPQQMRQGGAGGQMMMSQSGGAQGGGAAEMGGGGMQGPQGMGAAMGGAMGGQRIGTEMVDGNIGSVMGAQPSDAVAIAYHQVGGLEGFLEMQSQRIDMLMLG